MKKTTLILCCVCIQVLIYAQNTVLSGTVTNSKGSPVTVYLLYGALHTKNYTVDIKLSPQGRFRQSLQLPYPVFALLKYKGGERRLLLSPGRNLELTFNANAGEDSIILAGTAQKENHLLKDMRLGEMPFFANSKMEDNPYVKMPIDSLSLMLQDIRTDIAYTDKKIALADIPDQQRFMLLNETHYALQCYLNDFYNMLRWSRNNAKEAFAIKMIDFEPLPGNASMVNGVYAGTMLSNYIGYQLNEANKDWGKDSVAAKKRFEKALHTNIEDIRKQAEIYGEVYILGWLYAKYNLPQSIHDKYLFNTLLEAVDNKQLAAAVMLLDTLQQYYSYSQYIPMAAKEVKQMQDVLATQTLNERIHFYPDKKVKSLQELIAPYKGKVVYLDICGTWCGPCREEMKYTPELKKRYTGKDIVFVYLDMDDDSKEGEWKEFTRLNKLEGEHYRLTNTEIQPLWKVIADAGGKNQSYPAYILFDKNGTIVKADAERPSSGEALYKQLDNALQ